MPSTGRGPRTRLRPEERQAQIVGAARKLALEAGLTAVTLRAVAAEVGVAPGLVAHYEPSMEELTARTFASIVADELAEVGRMAGAEREPRARLAALLATLLEPRRVEVTLVWVQAWALGGRSAALARAVREQMDAWEAVLAELVDGVVGEPADSRVLARQILGMIDGLNAHALVHWRDDDRLGLLTRSVEALLRLPTGSLPRRDGTPPPGSRTRACDGS